jgi:signal transduction histidine kinase
MNPPSEGASEGAAAQPSPSTPTSERPTTSVAGRVARAAGLAAAIASLVAALFTGGFGFELLRKHTENAASSAAQSLAQELHEEEASGPIRARIPDEIRHFGRMDVRYVVFEDGEEVYRSNELPERAWPAAGDCTRWDEEQAEVCTSTVGDVRVVTVMKVPADESTLVLGALLAAITAAALGMVVAFSSTRQALEPLSRLARGAASIQPGRLDARALGEDEGLEEIDALRGQLRAAFHRSDDAVKTLARFGATAAHELRGPLASLRAELDLAIEHRHMELDTMHDLAQRIEHLSSLVEQLLMIAAPEQRTLRVSEVVALRALVDDVVTRPAPTLAAAGRVIATVDATSDEGLVEGDRALLRSLIDNGVDNARKFARSTVHVRVRRDQQSVVVEVEDDGPGLADDELTKVFEPFFRSERARESGVEGHGLGLALVRQIARMHGGDAEMARSELGGARLTVRMKAAL